MYFAEIVADYQAKNEYLIFYQDDVVTCIERTLNHTMIKPDFAHMRYMGISMVGFEKCNHWVHEERRHGSFFQLWDRVSDREIMRADFVRYDTDDQESWTFWEMDVAAQDPDVFVIPDALQAVCNQER